jgi:dihydroneopterin aldolase
MHESITVNLKAMRFMASVGLLDEERIAPQPIEVDISVVCSRRSTEGSGYVDYRLMYDAAAHCVASRHHELLEEIARGIGDSLERIPGVASLRVAVRKMRVPLPGPLDYSEVVVERSAGA